MSLRKVGMGKKGLSELVAYVLLIVISFSLAGMVYSWLKFYVNPPEEPACDEGVSLILSSYNYDCDNKVLTLGLQNKGLFNVDGFAIRVNNNTNSKLGAYKLITSPSEINIPAGNSSDNLVIDLNNEPNIIGGTINFIEIQPYILKTRTPVYCKNIIKQTISCSVQLI